MKKKDTARHHDMRSFRGLTIEEMRVKMVVNAMKINAEKKRALSAILPGSSPVETTLFANMGRIESFMGYAAMVFSAFRMGRRVVNFFRGFRK